MTVSGRARSAGILTVLGLVSAGRTTLEFSKKGLTVSEDITLCAERAAETVSLNSKSIPGKTVLSRAPTELSIASAEHAETFLVETMSGSE